MHSIVSSLLDWYKENKRLLPWRIDKDPYHIWISEIMLQQTRIEAVKTYYERFITRIPTIEELAIIEEDKLLKLWQGLGYYNRARNLKKAAQVIVTDYNGKFPNEYTEILKLPGIGEYTASAIGSICFSLKYPTIDGNVLRVMTRLTNNYNNIDNSDTRNAIKEQLLTIIPDNSGDFNEALMELGETICLPNITPKCEQCPLSPFCQAKKYGTQMDLPIRNIKKSKKLEYHTVLLLIYQDKIAITKRDDANLLHKLWQFPNIENILTEEGLINWLDKHTIEVDKIILGNKYQHVFTHKIWQNQIYILYVKNILPQYTWVTISQIEKEYAMPTAFMPVLNQYKYLTSQNK